jgi:hypothetical protein
MTSPFEWNNGQPSIVADDKDYRAVRDGKTKSQLQTENVANYRKRHGRCPGSVPGLSARGDEIIKSFSSANRRKT